MRIYTPKYAHIWAHMRQVTVVFESTIVRPLEIPARIYHVGFNSGASRRKNIRKHAHIYAGMHYTAGRCTLRKALQQSITRGLSPVHPGVNIRVFARIYVHICARSQLYLGSGMQIPKH